MRKRRVEERTAELAHANAVLRQRVEEYRLERENGLVQVQHEMQNLEGLGQLAQRRQPLRMDPSPPPTACF